jgi:tetratricopeptide (TPR) repeat protein
MTQVGWSRRLVFMASIGAGGALLIGPQAGWTQSAADYRQQGLAYRASGQLPDAIAALRQAVALQPDHLDGRVTLGWTLHLAGDDRAAADVLQATLARDPFHVPSLNALGIVYLVNEDLPGAVLAHTWASWLKPDNEVAYYNLSLAFQRSTHYDWAISNAEKAAELEPANPHPFVALAIAHWSQDNRDAAQQAYQQAIDLDGRYSDNQFLDYLDESGFNDRQIELSKQVLASLR